MLENVEFKEFIPFENLHSGLPKLNNTPLETIRKHLRESVTSKETFIYKYLFL